MGESTPLLPSHNEYYEEPSLSKRTKIVLGAVATVLGAFFLWLLCIYLPNSFIPAATSLEGIPRLSELAVGLRPLTAERVHQLGLEPYQAEEEDDDDDEELNFESDLHLVNGKKTVERLIMIGDIHGQYHEFKSLLKKIQYSPSKDHVLVLGDFITKGPDSFKVLDFLIDNDIDCIMGNHEYYVLQYYAQYHGKDAPFFVQGNTTGTSRDSRVQIQDGFNSDPEFLLAKKLEINHVKYINKCSIIKKLGQVPLHKVKNSGSTKSAHGVAVHAGLSLDVSLEDQDPVENLEMRSYIGPDFNRSTSDPFEDNAVSWSKVFNARQKELDPQEALVVYYGHDARRSLSVRKFTKGIDTGCNRGDQLTAMVLWQESVPGKKGRIVHREQAVSVDCN